MAPGRRPCDHRFTRRRGCQDRWRCITATTAGLAAERLALLALLPLLPLLAKAALAAALLLAAELAADTSARADELLQPGLDVALAVVGLVRDPLNEIVDVTSRVEVRGADLSEFIEKSVPDLLPVLPQLLFDLLLLLLLCHHVFFLSPGLTEQEVTLLH